MINLSEIASEWPVVDGWSIAPEGNPFTEAGNKWKVGSDAFVGHGFKTGDEFTVGDCFKAGNCFTVGNEFKTGNCFKAGDEFTVGDGFKAGNWFTVGDEFETGNCFKAGKYGRGVMVAEIQIKYIPREDTAGFKEPPYLQVFREGEDYTLFTIQREYCEHRASAPEDVYEYIINAINEHEERKPKQSDIFEPAR